MHENTAHGKLRFFRLTLRGESVMTTLATLHRLADEDEPWWLDAICNSTQAKSHSDFGGPLTEIAGVQGISEFGAPSRGSAEGGV